MARWRWAREEWRGSETTPLVFKEQQCSCTCLHQMRPDKTPQVTVRCILKSQQCSCTCLHQMSPDKTPQVAEQQCSCTCLQLMRPDKAPQLTGYKSIRCILKISSAVPVSTRWVLRRHHRIQEHQVREIGIRH
ncbi:hypothetical protein Bbelb_250250 [Branchiostoma belcheri]|nr:hypothetical protein Bbelb_250250 [Branchiostoma belcheri]